MRCGCGLERMGLLSLKSKSSADRDRPIRIHSWDEPGALVGHPDKGLDFRAVMSSPYWDIVIFLEIL